MIGKEEMLGLANRFIVDVGGVPLGSWSKCEGLKVDFKAEKRKSGGEYDRIYYLPTQIEYSSITLTRAMSKEDSGVLFDWLRKKAAEYNDIGGNLAYQDETATITLYDAHGQSVRQWVLRGVHVESWQGPTFDAMNSKIALEVLKLSHEGFL